MSTHGKNIKVLQLCAVGFTIKNFLTPLINFLMCKGCDVTVCCEPGEYEDEFKDALFSFHPIPFRRNMNVISHLKAMRHLRDYLRQEHFDIVHCHTPIAALIGRIAAKKSGVPIVLYTAHGFYFHDRMHPLYRRFHVALEKIGARYTDFLFTQSEEDHQTAIREGIISEKKISTIGNGVDINRFNPELYPPGILDARRHEFQIPSKAPVVGIIGRLVREKGYLEFFRAAAIIRERNPRVHFLIIGSALQSDYDESVREFHSVIDKGNLRPFVHFAGLRTDVPELLGICTAFCLPSYREGMPRSIIEAMAMEKPVVATDIRGCREEVVDGETGYLVPVCNEVVLAGRLMKILEDPSLCVKMGKAGRRRVLELYDERKVLERQWEVYERLLSEKSIALTTE